MYLIIDSTKRIVEICKHPSYVRCQENGVIILSDKAHADAIYSNDSNTFYQTQKIGYLCESHNIVEVDSIPAEVVPGYYFYHAGEFYTTKSELDALSMSNASKTSSIVFVKMSEKEEFDDTTILEHSDQFSWWVYPVSYTEKQIRRDPLDGNLYRVNVGQSHTSQEGWNPSLTPALWTKIGNPKEEWPAWSQPIGAHDSYELGAKVSHNNKYWTSDYNNNVWEPGVYGWTEHIE